MQFQRTFLSLVVSLVAVASPSPVRAGEPGPAPDAAWQKVAIPGAVCGNGRPYSVFVRSGDPSRWLLEFMGGGACWNAESCVGSKPSTIVFELPFVPNVGGILSKEAWNPLANDSVVFFPYCTGDVHVGTHTAHYGDVTIEHRGKINVELALQTLVADPATDFTSAARVVVHGASAGALGALFHVQTIDGLLKPWVERVLVADSPGLHFGPQFWAKFTPELLVDYDRGFERAGMRLNPGSGLISGLVPELCRRLPNWRVGVLQATRDSIMSTKFGEITPEEHAKLVLGPAGVAALTSDPTDHCSSWIPDSSTHTFLLSTLSSWTMAGMVSAQDYVRELVEGTDGPNHLPRGAAPSSSD